MFVKCIKNMVEELDNTMQVYYVHKRTDHKEEVSFDKIVNRIKNLSSGLSINPTFGTKNNSRDLWWNQDPWNRWMAAQLCASPGPEHPDYLSLASRIEISNLHKNTSPSFSETITLLYNNRDLHDTHCPLITKELFDIVQKGKSKLNSYIKYERDDLISHFGLKTLQKSYPDENREQDYWAATADDYACGSGHPRLRYQGGTQDLRYDEWEVFYSRYTLCLTLEHGDRRCPRVFCFLWKRIQTASIQPCEIVLLLASGLVVLDSISTTSEVLIRLSGEPTA